MSAVACLHLRFLRLRFDTGNLDPTQTTYHFGEIDEMTPGRQRPLYPPNDPAPAPLTPAELSLNSLDMDALMGRLESIPSLEAALILLPSSRRGEPNFERTITKGTSRLAGQEQWQSWLHGKHRFVIEVHSAFFRIVRGRITDWTSGLMPQVRRSDMFTLSDGESTRGFS